MSRRRRKYKKASTGRNKKIKTALLVAEIIIILVLAFAAAMVLIPNAKLKLISSMTSSAPGRALISFFIGSDYEKYLQDANFNSDNVDKNDNLNIGEEYTNIALFGSDSRGSDLTSGAHFDSTIIVSMNNKTGEVKMVSVYRDTVLEFVADGDVYYDKATNANAYGNTETVLNMLNANLDLDITDYAVVNFAGLANVIDALGGMDVTITKDEMQWINNYLGETREVTGMTTLNVTKSGAVHLTGLQATAYSRIRQVAFYNEDGTSVNNDYGRTARQRLVLMNIFQKAKSAGASEMLQIANALFKKNSGDDKFLVTSMDLNEILKLIPTAIKFNITGTTGFPTELTSGTFYNPVVYRNGKQMSLYNKAPSCVFVKGLERNVTQLHEFLFGTTDYVPTKNVQEINDILITLTGVEPETNAETESSAN
ncbi:LCP family protein [Parasporobacterium paucivorans]|uniref:Transcriptional attenuator, LytR family n=1 Tax=Parasporobacterium paucivorans DSM 15970 TaxID=1122934 RepID=A0A1M6H667_9FIRM|nr:LCP family protein [Parasporobacterium paucivorans]SHJ17718.1 transcriptional attenuator, LytR family [Parasporobacterium paucivorans DSM 15970]